MLRIGGGEEWVSIFVLYSVHTSPKHECQNRLEKYSEIERLETCGGMLSISKPKRGYIRVRCTHNSHHEHSKRVSALTLENIGRIQTLANHGLAPFQICNIMNSEGRQVKWNLVHNRWSRTQKSIYL